MDGGDTIDRPCGSQMMDYIYVRGRKQDDQTGTRLAISVHGKGEMKGKRNEASQPRLDIIFSTSYAFSKNIFIDIGLDPDMYRDT